MKKIVPERNPASSRILSKIDANPLERERERQRELERKQEQERRRELERKSGLKEFNNSLPFIIGGGTIPNLDEFQQFQSLTGQSDSAQLPTEPSFDPNQPFSYPSGDAKWPDPTEKWTDPPDRPPGWVEPDPVDPRYWILGPPKRVDVAPSLDKLSRPNTNGAAFASAGGRQPASTLNPFLEPVPATRPASLETAGGLLGRIVALTDNDVEGRDRPASVIEARPPTDVVNQDAPPARSLQRVSGRPLLPPDIADPRYPDLLPLGLDGIPQRYARNSRK
ncbi:hypothetical protein [Bradyrhizobium sp. Ce-3]|uniref:hypothetical protein n=1 Tax=Bradyrhizobium sp. Ce-3 TaxID=2913970 RepID=UPI001FC8D1BC|nr:hypothetical protein [Bradyrhizobium sp. Ce-3]GKQ52858.1 hypothetical protein BRSPCE3_37130 [Bradyrhizobium sp. Ce-3]